jgi:hypothetical protein
MIAVALATAVSAMAKEDARARLLTVVPDAEPGSVVHVEWEVDVADGRGGRRGFGADGMFVRLLSATGARETEAVATGAHELGHYEAAVRVPDGGISGIRFGLQGTSCGRDGCRAAPLLFPLVNDPFAARPVARKCDAADVGAELRTLVRAYNAADVATLDALFSRTMFVWYSVAGPGARSGTEAQNRGTLATYFAQRHARGDRLALLGFHFNGYDARRHLGHFSLSLRRRAAAFRDGNWFRVRGKGALDCSASPAPIAALSLGGPTR